MSETKTMIRFFTIADYEDEEIWLREQHRKGWKLQRMIVPCFYIFEACTPEDVIYRLDYRNNEEDSEYLQLFRDYGWEQFARCMGWLYFRKSASEIESEEDGEIFSDDASRVELVDQPRAVLAEIDAPLVIVAGDAKAAHLEVAVHLRRADDGSERR